MSSERSEKEEAGPGPSNLSGGMDMDETVLGDPEPWAPWETRLVLWSLAIGGAGLVVLGLLVNAFLL